MFLVFSNFDFQFLTMTSRGGQYFYSFSSAFRLIEYNSSITVKLTNFATFSLKRSWQKIFIVICCFFQIFRKIFFVIKKLSYTKFYRKLVTWCGWSMAIEWLGICSIAKKTLRNLEMTWNLIFETLILFEYSLFKMNSTWIKNFYYIILTILHF